ncbi:MAG: hypothetical protein AAGH92_10935 [Planctomycetota bacterium]
MSDPQDNVNPESSLESQLDALLSQVEAAPPEATQVPEVPEAPASAESAGEVPTVPDAVDAEASADTGPDAVAAAESAIEATSDLASKLDAMFDEPKAETESEPEINAEAELVAADAEAVGAVETTPAQDTPVSEADAGDLASKLDAMFEAPQAETRSETDSVAEPSPADAGPVEPVDQAAAEDVVVAAEQTADLASKLDAVLAGEVEAVDQVGAADETDGAGVPGDLASQLDAVLAATADAPEEPTSEAAEEVAELPNSEPDPTPVPEGVEDEAELLAAVESDVAAEAEAALEETQAGGDFSALADMLGVDAATLAEVPEASAADPEPPAEPDAEPQAASEAGEVAEDDEASEDALDGAFASVDDLLAETDPALAELNADEELIASESAEVETPEASTEESEFDGSFESVDGMQGEPVAEEATPEPLVAAEKVEAAAAPEVSDEAEGDDEFDGMFASVDEVLSEPDVEASEAPSAQDSTKSGDKPKATGKKTVEVTIPSFGQITETAVSASKQAAAKGQDVAIRVRPHAIKAAKLSYRGVKIGCFRANGSLDSVGDKFKKEDREAPPIKQYTGIAAMAILVPGVLLVLIGLLT